jgi:hypothetical protein
VDGNDLSPATEDHASSDVQVMIGAGCLQLDRVVAQRAHIGWSIAGAAIIGRS